MSLLKVFSLHVFQAKNVKFSNVYGLPRLVNTLNFSTTTDTTENKGNKQQLGGKDLAAEIKEANSKLEEMKSSYLLCLADMENLRAQTKREIEVVRSFALQKFCKDLIGVVDILGMALESTVKSNQPEKDKFDSLFKGLEMTNAEFSKVLNKHGVEEIDPLHQKFDPNIHNALYQSSDSNLDPGVIISVQKKGYVLNGRVIRPADVGVSK